MIVVIMGVAGSGKTTMARMLASKCNGTFIEGDEFHPPENVAKMAGGVPLDDADRWEWLDAIAAAAREVDDADSVVAVSCSALKKIYRERLRRGMGGHPRFVLLRGDAVLLGERMGRRKGHFMPESLLRSQLATLEEPDGDEHAICLDTAMAPGVLVDRAAAALRLKTNT